MKTKSKGESILSFTDGHWEWFRRTESLPYEVSGKYLFFSAKRNLLAKIAKSELESGGFHLAKIPMKGKNISAEYVPCLYYKDDTKKHELAKKYQMLKDVSYKYWKSDESTLQGEYSEQFLQSLAAHEKKVPSTKKRPK